MSRYIPMPSYPDRMPVDISFVFEDEKPAGKHGFLKVDGEDMRFEDGTLAKFWGVNINAGACFPSHEYAEKFARRITQAGCNIVRLHQMDAEWATPNIFAFTRGKLLDNTRHLDARSMEALDYLLFCLKREGVYCYPDLNTYRKFKKGDGVVDTDTLVDSGKPWSIIDRRMIELQKEFATQFWTHVNPYTGLAYCDDPMFVMCDIINEVDLFTDSFSAKYNFKKSPYHENNYRQLLKAWLEEHGVEYDWEHQPIFNDHEETMPFKVEITKKFYREMYDHLRSIGVKVPITGTNWSREYAGNSMTMEEMDYTDSHKYIYDYRWGNTERLCKNQAITEMKGVWFRVPYLCLPNKPFFLSEWDVPWPNSYRAEGPLYYAAIGGLQNWTGFTIHTYSYGTNLDSNSVLGREMSTPLAGVPYREGIFCCWNDPAKFGLFYHAALMMRRGDVAPANKKIAVKLSGSKVLPYTAYDGIMEQHKVGTVFSDDVPQGYERVVDVKDEFPHPEPKMIRSDNGQLWRDLKRKIGVIDTERTKAVYGSIGMGANRASTTRDKDTTIALNGLTVAATTDFGVIALSSLTDDALEHSNNILLSAIGRARNTDMMFDGEKMVDIGKAPVLAEVIQAEISLKTDRPNMKVWGVNAEGYLCGFMMTEYKDGYLKFRIGDEQNPACYYLIFED